MENSLIIFGTVCVPLASIANLGLVTNLTICCSLGCYDIQLNDTQQTISSRIFIFHFNCRNLFDSLLIVVLMSALLLNVMVPYFTAKLDLAENNW